MKTAIIWERGTAWPDIRLLHKLAKLLGCTIDALLAEDNAETA